MEQTKKVYGIWAGSGWIRNGDGIPVHSEFQPVMAVYKSETCTFWPEAEVREIGSDGKPVVYYCFPPLGP